MKRVIKFVVAGLAMFLVAESPLLAQQRGGGRGDFNIEEMRARQLERIQEEVGASAQEWRALRPLVEGVLEAQRQVNVGRGGFGGFGGGRGGAGGFGGGRGGAGGAGGGPGGGAPEVQALRQAVESGNTADIQAKLKELRAVREAREKALKDARDKLRSVVSVKQEGALVAINVLD